MCLPRRLAFTQSVLGLEELGGRGFLSGVFGAEYESDGFELAGGGNLAFEGALAFGLCEFFLCITEPDPDVYCTPM